MNAASKNAPLTNGSPASSNSARSGTVTVSTSGPTDLAGNFVDPAANDAGFTGVATALNPPVITTNGGVDFRTNQTSVTLSGTTDAATNAIEVNGGTMRVVIEQLVTRLRAQDGFDGVKQL